MISFGTCKRIGRRQESSVNEAPKKSEHSSLSRRIKEQKSLSFFGGGGG